MNEAAAAIRNGEVSFVIFSKYARRETRKRPPGVSLRVQNVWDNNRRGVGRTECNTFQSDLQRSFVRAI